MKQTKVIVTSLLFLLSSSELFSQEAIAAAGNDATGPGGTASYTIGQIDYTFNSGTTGQVSQGVQQAYEIFSTAGAENLKIELNVTSYPNPTNGVLTINVGSFASTNLSYQLFDIQGKLLEEKKISQKETQVSMEELMPASYLLKIIDQNQSVKEFKIIKN